MIILTYDGVKDKESTLRAMTSLDKEEFEELGIFFKEAWDEKAEREGRNPSKGGRKTTLQSVEDRLFFILFYLKIYPLQEVIGHLFGMSQGQANIWIHKRKGYGPTRLPEEMRVLLEKEVSQDLGIGCGS